MDIRDSQVYYIGDLGPDAEHLKPRYVRFDMNAFAELEKLYGTMDEANKALQSGSVFHVRRVLWAGLIHDNVILDEITGEPIGYTIKIFDVGSWLTQDNMEDVINKLVASMRKSVPEDDSPKQEIKLNAVDAMMKEKYPDAFENPSPNA